METLLKASEADWALAKRRERVLSKLAASKECSRAMIDKACVKLQLSRAMVFRLLARYREDRRLSALLLHPRGRKCRSGGLREEQEQIIAAQIRKIGGKKRLVAALHRKIAAACRKRRLPIPSYGTVLRRFQAHTWRTS
jgi:putative transposase